MGLFSWGNPKNPASKLVTSVFWSEGLNFPQLWRAFSPLKTILKTAVKPNRHRLSEMWSWLSVIGWFFRRWCCIQYGCRRKGSALKWASCECPRRACLSWCVTESVCFHALWALSVYLPDRDKAGNLGPSHARLADRKSFITAVLCQPAWLLQGSNEQRGETKSVWRGRLRQEWESCCVEGRENL